MTHAERQKRYQKKLLVQALSTNAVTRRKAQKLLQRQKTRKKANRPVLNGQSSVRQRSSNPTMTWMSMTRKFSASNLRTHLQHAVAAPAVVDGCQLPKAPNPDDRDVWLKDDAGVWRLWLHRKASEIPKAGSGLFAARSFELGSFLPASSAPILVFMSGTGLAGAAAAAEELVAVGGSDADVADEAASRCATASSATCANLLTLSARISKRTWHHRTR